MSLPASSTFFFDEFLMVMVCTAETGEMNSNEHCNLKRRARKGLDHLLQKVGTEDEHINKPIRLSLLEKDVLQTWEDPWYPNWRDGVLCSERLWSLLSSLADCTVSFSLSLCALSASRYTFPSCQKEGRSLHKTKTDYKVEMLAGGSFHYFCIMNAVLLKFSRLFSSFPEVCVFQLQLNFDGLPLFLKKASPFSFGPFLNKLPRLPKKPFCLST